MPAPTSVAKQLFAAFLLGDRDGVIELADPDGTWRFAGDPAVVPWAGEYTGRELGRFVDTCHASVEYLAFQAHTLRESGDYVLVLCHERCRARATGRVFEQDFATVLTVRDGRVVAFVEFADPAVPAGAFR